MITAGKRAEYESGPSESTACEGIRSPLSRSQPPPRSPRTWKPALACSMVVVQPTTRSPPSWRASTLAMVTGTMSGSTQKVTSVSAISW